MRRAREEIAEAHSSGRQEVRRDGSEYFVRAIHHSACHSEAQRCVLIPGHADETSDPLRHGHIVVVQEDDELASCGCKTEVARGTDSQSGSVEDANGITIVTRRDVRAAIVNDDHFDARMRLQTHRCQGFADTRRACVRRNDGSYLGRHGRGEEYQIGCGRGREREVYSRVYAVCFTST